MMYGPTNAKDHEKETAGAIMVTRPFFPFSSALSCQRLIIPPPRCIQSFFLNFGIFLAAHFAILLLYAVEGTLPWDSS